MNGEEYSAVQCAGAGGSVYEREVASVGMGIGGGGGEAGAGVGESLRVVAMACRGQVGCPKHPVCLSPGLARGATTSWAEVVEEEASVGRSILRLYEALAGMGSRGSFAWRAVNGKTEWARGGVLGAVCCFLCWNSETNDCGEDLIRVGKMVAFPRCFFAEYTGVVRDSLQSKGPFGSAMRAWAEWAGQAVMIGKETCASGH